MTDMLNYRGTLYVVGPTADRVLFALDRLAGSATHSRVLATHTGKGEDAVRNCLYALMEKGLVDRHHNTRCVGRDGTILTEWCLTEEGQRAVQDIRKHQTVTR